MEQLNQLIDAAAAEQRLPQEDLDLLNNEARQLLVGQDLITKNTLKLTSYNELVALQLRAGAAKVVKILFPDPTGRQLLNAAEWLRQAVPQLNRRVSERTSCSKTRPRHPRTFQELYHWPAFEAGVKEMMDRLSQQPGLFYDRVTWDVTGGRAATAVLTAADKAEVRGALMFNALKYINQVAQTLGLACEYQGNGSGRAMSYTDIVLRQVGVTDNRDLSQLILGVLEVKGSWQLRLPAKTDLVSAQHDPKLLKICLPALQQAFGDAVTDEAPLLMLSTYDSTYFILRDTEDVTKKHLLVSKPVPYCGSQDVPFLSAWLYALEVAHNLWKDGVKAKLRRNSVPTTPVGGYQQQQPVSDSEQPACRLDAKAPGGFRVIGSRQQPPCQGKTHLGLLEERADVASGTSSTGSTSSNDDDIDGLPELTFEELGFTSHCLSSGSNRHIVEGAWLHKGTRQKAALKVYNDYDPQALQDFRCELQAYRALAPFQRSIVSELLTVGRLPHTGAPVLVLLWGEPMPDTPLYQGKAKLAVKRLHDAGVSHGDIRAENFLVCGDTVVLCDLETCKFNASNEDFQADELALQKCWA